MVKDYVSPRLFALCSLTVLIGATLYLADRLSPPAVAAILASLANVVFQVMNQAGGIMGGGGRNAATPVEGSPDSTRSTSGAVEVGRATRAALLASPAAAIVVAALTIAVSLGVATGCGAHASASTRAHVVEILAGDCVEIAHLHAGDTARKVELVCNLVEGIADRAAEKSEGADAGSPESD